MVPLVRVFLVVLFATSVVCVSTIPVISAEPEITKLDNGVVGEDTSKISPQHVASADKDSSRQVDIVEEGGDSFESNFPVESKELTVEELLDRLSEESRKQIKGNPLMMDILRGLGPAQQSVDVDGKEEETITIEKGLLQASLSAVYIQKDEDVNQHQKEVVRGSSEGQEKPIVLP